MKRDPNMPNQTANKSKAEGERWRSDSDTVERRERLRDSEDRNTGDRGDDAGGITNRPLDEEERNQDLVPGRGDSREGAHAGHGDRNRTQMNEEE